MEKLQCCFLNAPLLTDAVRMFQMAGQVCRVTLGGIQPTGGPPPVLRPVQLACACPKPLPGLRTRGSWRGGSFPAIGFGTHLWPAQVSLPPRLCIEDAQRWQGSTAEFRL